MQTGEGVIKFFEAFNVGQSVSLVKGWAVAGCDLLTTANSTDPWAQMKSLKVAEC